MPKKITLKPIDSEALTKMTTREALAYWLSVPSKVRNPHNQKGLAALLNVSEERLCQIKRDPKFQNTVQTYRKEFFRQFTSDVMESLVESATDGGNERAAKLFLQVVEDFQESTKQEQVRTEVRTFVLELPEAKLRELRGLIQQMRQEEAKAYIDAEVVVPLLPEKSAKKEDTGEEIPEEAKSG
jgi:hypothetical protein